MIFFSHNGKLKFKDKKIIISVQELELEALYALHLQKIALLLNGRNIVFFSGKGVFNNRTDNNYDFYSNVYFAYICYYCVSNCFVFVNNNKFILYISREYVNSYWHKALTITDTIKRFFLIKLYDKIENVINSLNNCEVICCKHLESIFTNISAIKNVVVNSPCILKLLDKSRAIKTCYEIECIKYATTIALNGFNAIRILLHTERFVSEQYIANIYLRHIGEEFVDLPYKPIVAINKNCSYLHYTCYSNNNINIYNSNVVKAVKDNSYSCLVDAGVSYRGYACDITITYSTDKLFNTLCNLVEEVKNKIIEYIKPYITFAQLQSYCEYLIAQVLFNIGIFDNTICTVEDLIEYKVVQYFFCHGFGHMLGLNVHDCNYSDCFNPLTLTRNSGELKTNMVITVEPGIYFIESLLCKFYNSEFIVKFSVNCYRQAVIDLLSVYGGVRQEVNVLITENKCINITAEIFNNSIVE